MDDPQPADGRLTCRLDSAGDVLRRDGAGECVDVEHLGCLEQHGLRVVAVGVWSAGECLMAFAPQAAGAVGLERLRAEALTSQDLADDADSLVTVDRFGQVGLSQGGVVRQKLVASTRAEGKYLALRP